MDFFLESKYPQCLTEDVEQIYVRIPYTIFVDPSHSLIGPGFIQLISAEHAGIFQKVSAMEWTPNTPFL